MVGRLWVLPILRFYELLLSPLSAPQLPRVSTARMTIIAHLTGDTGSFSGLYTFGYFKLFMSKLLVFFSSE